MLNWWETTQPPCMWNTTFSPVSSIKRAFLFTSCCRMIEPTLWLCLSFTIVASSGFIWLWWSPAGKQKPGCCFWREAVITCGLLSHLIKEEKLILESWDWNTHQQRCKACTHTYTHFNTCTYTYTHITAACTAINTKACTHIHTNTKAQRPAV